MNEFFLPINRIASLFKSRMKGAYDWGWNVVNASTAFNQYASDREKLAMILQNPAVLKVFSLQCDLFSMGRVCVKDADGNEIPDDPFLTLLKAPNPLTKTESQFLWDYMFYLMLGTANCYVNSSVVDAAGENVMYLLDPSKIDWPYELEKKKDKMIFSKVELKKMMETKVTYRYEDGSTFEFPLSRLIQSFDLTNGIGNYYRGPSRIDALYKVISNSEHILDAHNINIRYSGKFTVGSENKVGASAMSMPMSDIEKKDLESKIDGKDKDVFAIRAKVNIERFVSDLAALQLGPEYLHQYFIIGNMFNIPRDVLEAYNSATYENQEKARAAHVNYTLEPKGNQFMDSFEVFFGYRQQGKNIFISWDHLPFMQIFAKEQVEVKQANVNALNSLLGLGVSIENANFYLGTEFVIEPPKEIAADSTSPETLQAQAALRGSVGGVQGLLAIQASVSAGTTSRDSALAMLTTVYGFTGQQAADLLGETAEPIEVGQGQIGQGGQGEEENTGGQPDGAEVE